METESNRIVVRLGQDVRKWFDNYLNEGGPRFEDAGYVTLFERIEQAHLQDRTEGIDPMRAEDVRHVRNHISSNPSYIITVVGGIKHPQGDLTKHPACDPTAKHERSLMDQIYHIEKAMRDMDNHWYFPVTDGDRLDGVTGWDGKPVKWTISPLLKHNKDAIKDLWFSSNANDKDEAIRSFYASVGLKLKDLLKEERASRLQDLSIAAQRPKKKLKKVTL